MGTFVKEKSKNMLKECLDLKVYIDKYTAYNVVRKQVEKIFILDDSTRHAEQWLKYCPLKIKLT